MSGGVVNPRVRDLRIRLSGPEFKMQNRRSTKDNVCPRGDLNPQPREISPDRGNHAARIQGNGLTRNTSP